eukprot:SAG25_NODE_8098_length_440_cov_0.906158_1_plen_55_part_10
MRKNRRTMGRDQSTVLGTSKSGDDERSRSNVRKGSTVVLLTVVRMDHNHRLILQI